MATLQIPRSARARAALAAVVGVALVASSLSTLVLPAEAVQPLRAAAAAAAPTGGFAMHGGASGQIDLRTGQLSASVPLATVGSEGDASISFTLSWQQQRAAASIDRSGLGAGWSIGTSFVDVSGLQRVYPASGGSFFIDSTQPSGLQHYLLHDLTFARSSGTLPARSGVPSPISYSFELTYDDGRTDFFDANGNLVARTDRFDNRIDLTWRARPNNVWQPVTIIDSFGLATTFDYSTANQMKVVSPARADGVTATTTVALTTAQGVQSVTDPVGNKTTFAYAAVSGAPKPLISLITAATGARTAVTYQSPAYEPSLSAVATLRVTDGTGAAISPTQSFSLNPTGNNQHNFTGYPNHLGTGGQDALFASGDANYTYTTSLTTGAITTSTTYDALHRQVKKVIAVTPAPGQLPIAAQTHQVSYPTPVRIPALLPANFAHPTQVAVTESAATSTSGLKATAPRTSSTDTSYDDHGRVVSATNEVGTTTTTAYDDRFGLVTRQTTTGADGSQAQLVNTLTSDGTNIAGSTTSVGTDGGTLAARQTLAYEYDDDGLLTSRRLTWAPGAAPDPDDPGGGPDEIVTTFEHSVDLASKTRTITTTVGAGSDAAQPSTTTVDLVSGKVVSQTDALDRTTTLDYDAAGRRTEITTPGGLVTTTAYTPTRTTVTGPDGRVTRTTFDLLGRAVSITDNVQNGALVSDAGARTLTSNTYSADGASVTSTDQAGRSTTTVVDAFGRVVSKGGPTGLTHLTSFDDGAAHSEVGSVLPEGSAQPEMSTTTKYDNADRVTQARTTYQTDSPGGRPGGGFITGPVSSMAFNGLGQPTTNTQNDLTVTTERPGAGPTTATATPQPTGVPGDPISAVTTYALSGAATSRTLHQGTEVSRAVAVEYDAAGNLVSAVDPEGRTTSYTYTDDGLPETKTEPSGAVTTQTYSETSGLLSGVSTTAPGAPTRTLTYTRVPAGQIGAGQVKTVSDGTGTITYGYDADGHRTSVSYPDGTSTSASYNDKGQLVSTTDVTGAVTSYVYDPQEGSVVSATQRRSGAVVASISYTYDAMDRLATTTRGNGTVTTNTYTDENELASQSTATSGGQVIEAHTYTYDDHHNPATRTDTYAAGGRAAPVGGTWTTVYTYDAYDRLVRSAVYPGPLTNGAPTGIPVTTSSYTIDLGGDVVASTKTLRSGLIRPITTSTTSTNTIDDSGRLTAQKTGLTTTAQTYDHDGRVLTSLAGAVTTYLSDGSPATRTLRDGTRTTYALWPDGTRRSATTTRPDGTTSTVTFHYGVDNVLVNDSTTDPSTGSGTATTASYLVTAGREARTLLAGTATSGKVTGTPGAPMDTGAGVGYYLRDRHTSVTGMVDDAQTVTATYAYGDYGAPTRADGQPVTVAGSGGGRTNPYTYLGASPRGPTTDVGSGLLAFSARSYDPQQGRFTSPDPVDSHNRYQGFKTNPIVYVDLGGQISTLDIILDTVFAVAFVATAILTAGAGVEAVGAVYAAVEVGVELTVGAVANAVATTVGTLANITGAITSGILAADDIAQVATNGKTKVLNDDQRSAVQLANTIASATASVTGAVQGFTDPAVSVLKAATEGKATSAFIDAIEAAGAAKGDAAAEGAAAVEVEGALVDHPQPLPEPDQPAHEVSVNDANEQVVDGGAPKFQAGTKPDVPQDRVLIGLRKGPGNVGSEVFPAAGNSDPVVLENNPLVEASIDGGNVANHEAQAPAPHAQNPPVLQPDPIMQDVAAPLVAAREAGTSWKRELVLFISDNTILSF